MSSVNEGSVQVGQHHEQDPQQIENPSIRKAIESPLQMDKGSQVGGLHEAPSLIKQEHQPMNQAEPSSQSNGQGDALENSSEGSAVVREKSATPQREISYYCKYCGETCNSKKGVFKHINQWHMKIPTHECKLCGKQYNDLSYGCAIHHLQRKHPSEVGSLEKYQMKIFVRKLGLNIEKIVNHAENQYFCMS